MGVRVCPWDRVITASFLELLDWRDMRRSEGNSLVSLRAYTYMTGGGGEDSI